ncbi:MAG: T9SS type A sorting domain-containing protein [Bacteroidota bacterium]
MKKLTFIFSVVLLVFCCSFLKAQTNATGVDPGKKKITRLSNKVYDTYGREYTMEDIIIKKKPGGVKAQETAGIFRLDFVDGGGTGFYDGTLGNQRRAVALQVYEDLSGLIEHAMSPYTTIGELGTTRFVEIRVSSIENASDPMLGMAGQFFPEWSLGISQGTVWQTLNSGIDFWTGIDASNFGNFEFYHGTLEINWGKPIFIWDDPYGVPAMTAGEYDLYTIILHEAIHQLGFGSLITGNGNSYITGTNPGIYSLYDTYLTDETTGNPLVTWNSSYNATFNTAYLGNLTSSCSIQFDGINPTFVTSPNVFNSASSLSHFPTSNCGNPNIYLMNPSLTGGPGGLHRFLDNSEVTALCDLHYETTGVFPGQPAQPVCGTRVAGVNDNCEFVGTFGNPGTPGVNFATAHDVDFTFNSTTLLANDENANWYDDLEVMNSSGTLTGLTSGGTGNTIAFNPNSNFEGVAILRYVPRESEFGQRGNYTYVFITVMPPDVILPACNATGECGENLICHGDIEDIPAIIGGNPNLSGRPLSDAGINNLPATNSPDLFPVSGIAYFNPIFYCGNDPGGIVPPHAFLGANVQYMGLGNHQSNREIIYFPLKSPLIIGQSYSLSFYAYGGCDVNVQFLFSENPPCGADMIDPTVGNTTVCGGGGNYTPVQSEILPIDVPIPMTWTLYPQNVIINQPNINYVAVTVIPNPNNAGASEYTLFDDFSLVAINQTELTTTLTQSVNSACPGENVQYTIEVCNNSGNDAVDVNITDNLPSGLTFQPGGTFTYPVTNIPLLVNGDCQVFTLNAQVNSTLGPLTNNVQLTSGGCNSTLSSTSVSLDIVTQSLSLSSSTSASVVCPGTTIPYSIEVCNPEATPVNGIGLQTTIPAGFAAVPGSGYTVTPTTVTWDPFTLNGGTITNPACTTLVVPITVNAATGNICTEIVSGVIPCNNSETCVTVSSNYCSATPSITIPNGAFSTAFPFIAEGTLVEVLGTYNINSDVTYSGVLFRMSPNASIVVQSGSDLTLSACFLFSCTGQWTGIRVQPGGSLVSGKGTVIQDAVNGVTAMASASPTVFPSLTINTTIFNHNSNGVLIESVLANMQPTNSNIIKNTIFTNRDLGCFTPGVDFMAVLKNDLINENYTNWPGSTAAGTSGIKIALNTANNNIYTIGLPDASNWTNNLNIYDNLSYGIISMSSNIHVKNSLFQNLLGNSYNSSNPSGVGVFYSGLENKSVTVGNTVSNLNSNTNEWNKFRNCLRGISAWSSSFISSFNNVFTNATTSSTFSGSGTFNRGEYAIFLQPVSSLTTSTLRIEHNNIYNCATGVYINRTSSTPTAIEINIDCNTMSSGNQTNQYMQRGIYLIDPITNTPTIDLEKYRIRYNNINNAITNAIYAQNVKKGLYIFQNSHLSILFYSSTSRIQDIVKTRDVIRLASCANATILNNGVITTSNGNTQKTTEVLTGINITTTPGLTLSNNTVSYVGTCIVFTGNCGASALRSSFFTLNTMKSAKYGLYMNTAASFNIQGSGLNTTGNRFGEIGTAPNNLTTGQTFCNSGTNINVNAQMYVYNVAPSGGLTHVPYTNLVGPATGSSAYTVGNSPSFGIIRSTASPYFGFACLNCNCNAYGTLPSMLAQPAIVSENPEENTFEEKTLNDDSNAGFENTVKVYPNPNSGSFKLQYNVREEGTLNFQLCDYSGKVIVNNLLETGEKTVDINLGDYPGGIYFYRLLSSGGAMIASGKVSVIR